MSDRTEENKLIHEWLGECWHLAARFSESGTHRQWDKCVQCKQPVNPPFNPDYFTSLADCWEAQARAIEVFGGDRYIDAVSDIVERPDGLLNLLTASAEQRAQAIVNLIRAENREEREWIPKRPQ